ncbi:MAG: ABC transporter ATP-binding protein [Pseudomonadota bacterium]
MHLENVLHQRIETLSKGYKRRVGLAQAIMHDPDILILDEPTDGLDPNQKHEVRTLIKDMASEKAIIISTHILEEVDAVCSQAVIIAQGKIIFSGTPNELAAHSRYHNIVSVTVAKANAEKAIAKAKTISGVNEVEELAAGEDVRIRLLGADGKQIIGAASDALREFGIKELHVERGHLDDVFRELTEGNQSGVHRT